MSSAASYISHVSRGCLALEIIDAGTQTRAERVAVHIEGSRSLPPDKRKLSRDVAPRFLKHESGLYALVYTTNLFSPARVSVTLLLTSLQRRYVPRRLRIPLVDPALPEFTSNDPPHAELVAVRNRRFRRIQLFPGSAYATSGVITGLRGRVRRGKQPVRWGRVEASVGQRAIGRAHTDERGEFFLILGALPEPQTAPGMSLSALVTVRAVAAALPPADGSSADLPVEDVGPSGPEDEVTRGTKVPAAFVSSTTRNIAFRIGTILTSEVEPFDLP